MTELSIRPDEIRDALAKYVSDYEPAAASKEEVGTVASAGDGIARVSGLPSAMANELLEFEDGTLGLALNLDTREIGVVILGDFDKIEEGQPVRRTGEILSVPVGDVTLGHVFNVIGEQLCLITHILGEPPKRGKPEEHTCEHPEQRQSQRIAAAARAHVGGTVLVVVGEFHKYDIEAILASTPGIEVVQPSQIGLPSAEQIAAHHQRDYYLAIARFNLLGAQAATGNVDWDWIGRVLDALTRESDNAEVALLRTRYARLRGTMSRENAIVAYQEIANRADASQPAGQHPSPAPHATGVVTHWAVHDAADPVRSAVEHAGAWQLVGQAPGEPAEIAGSHSSPGSRAPSPQLPEALLGDWLLGDWLLGDWLLGDWLLGDWLLGDWLLV